MKKLCNYIFEKLVIDRDIKPDKKFPDNIKILDFDEKLKEILEQGIKDGDYDSYDISKTKTRIIISFNPQLDFTLLKSEMEIIKVNLDVKYDKDYKRIYISRVKNNPNAKLGILIDL